MSASRRTWTTRIVVTSGLWLVTCVVAYLLGNQPRPGLIALVVAAGAGTLWLYLDTSAASEPVRWRLVTDEPVRPRGEDSRLAMLQRVVSQHLDSRDATDQLHRHLSDIADRRLVSKHGITRSADPEGAVRLLGRELVEFIEQPHRRPLSASEIDRLLNRIEAL